MPIIGGSIVPVSDTWQERKQEEVTHPLLEQPIPLGLIPLVQARLLARSLRGEMPEYIPFTLR